MNQDHPPGLKSDSSIVWTSIMINGYEASHHLIDGQWHREPSDDLDDQVDSYGETYEYIRDHFGPITDLTYEQLEAIYQSAVDCACPEAENE